MLGNQYRLGKIPSNARKLIDITTNIVYPSIKIAARELDLKQGTLTVRLRETRLINNTNLRYL
jgi:hypothetical protein